MIEVNIKTNKFKKCAFCRHWYDPTNSAIAPVNARLGIWNYNSNITQQCLIKGKQRKSIEFCNDFEKKL